MDNSSGTVCQDVGRHVKIIPPSWVVHADKKPPVKAAGIVTYLPYQIVGAVHQVFTLVGCILTIPLFWCHIRKLTVHANTKILLVNYFFFSMVHVISTTGQKIHQDYKALTYSNPCELLLDKRMVFWVYRVILFNTFESLLCVQILWVELFFSSMFYKTYEHWGKSLGIILLLASLICGILPIPFFSVDKPERLRDTFEYGTSQGTNSSLSSETLFAILLIQSFLGLVFTIVIVWYNQRVLKGDKFMLSSRFQISSNLVTVSILQCILLITLICNIFYAGGQLIMRHYRQEIFGDNLLAYMTARRCSKTIAFQIFLIPVAILYYLRRRTNEQRQKVKAFTEESNGATMKYAQYLSNQWECPHV